MSGSGLASMGWRNLWRHRRRTLITLSSIAFGTMLAIIFTGVQDYQWGLMIDLAARLGGGHVTLQHPEFLEKPTLGRTVRDVGALREAALRDEDVERVVTRITGYLMLASPDQSYGVGFIAFDPEQEDESTLSILEAIDAGRPFESRSDPGIILGARLAENLDVKLGRKVVYTTTDKDGEIVRAAARVIGVIRTGAPSVDSGLCLLTLEGMRDSLGYEPDEGAQVALFLRDRRRAREVAQRLDGLAPDVAALPWSELSPDLAGFIAMKVAGAIFMEVIIAVLVAAGIFNTLFVSVMERVREFGIMLALGFSPGRIFGLVMWESLWLGLTGLVAAALLTAGPYYYLSTTGIDATGLIGSTAEVAGVAVEPIYRVMIYPENLGIIAAAVLLATLLSGLYPAWQAGRVAPVESIRLV